MDAIVVMYFLVVTKINLGDTSMSTLEKRLKCPKCQWEGRRIVEPLKQQSDWKGFTTLISVGLRGVKCPICATSTVPSTKELVS